MRIGQGWDIHRLERGRRLVIGGIEIPSEAGAVAHSDGDVLAHAIIDALFGAIAVGDIGSHFPDTDPRWKDADSMILLSETAAVLQKAGYRIINIDSTVTLQTPKLRPHIDDMRRRIAEAAGTDLNAVSVKAKTNESLGDIGCGLAIEARAIVLVEGL